MQSTYTLGGWDLRDILAAPTGEPLDNLLESVNNAVAALEALRPKLSPTLSDANFNDVVNALETLDQGLWRLYTYASLWFAENTQNQTALAFLGKIQQIGTALQNRVLFIGLWWKGLDADNAARLQASVKPSVQYFFYHQRLTSQYVLSEQLEKLINIKDLNGVAAMVTIYDMLTNAYQFKLTVGGEEKTNLTREQLMKYVQGPVAELRAAAYQELYRQYAQDGLVLAQIYIHRVRDTYAESIEMRGYPSPIAIRNLANDIPEAAVTALLDVVTRNTSVFQRWFVAKAKLLGMPKLQRYDLYAPLSTADQQYDYDHAVKIVLETFYDFSPELGAAAERVFTENHIHSLIQTGKRGGGFCASIGSQITPYVLINYSGTIQQVSTLAHELGHAAHAILAEHHSVLTFHAALPLAETASVFSEMLLTDRLLAQETNPAVRREILASTLDDAYATIQRQAFFVLFEKQAHEMIAAGASVDELNQAYMANLRTQFGDSVELAPEFQWEWVCIPHIYHNPFYCYAYSFGQLLVLALYQRYKEQGAAFVPNYLKILSYGGSASPQYILNEAGIDICNPDFWQGGFNFISRLIDELETLVE